MVYLALPEIHFGHGQSRIQVFDFSFFSIQKTHLFFSLSAYLLMYDQIEQLLTRVDLEKKEYFPFYVHPINRHHNNPFL